MGEGNGINAETQRRTAKSAENGLGVLLMTLHQPVPAEMIKRAISMLERRHRRTEIMVAGGGEQAIELYGRDNGHLVPCPGPRTPEDGIVEG